MLIAKSNLTMDITDQCFSRVGDRNSGFLLAKINGKELTPQPLPLDTRKWCSTPICVWLISITQFMINVSMPGELIHLSALVELTESANTFKDQERNYSLTWPNVALGPTPKLLLTTVLSKLMTISAELSDHRTASKPRETLAVPKRIPPLHPWATVMLLNGQRDLLLVLSSPLLPEKTCGLRSMRWLGKLQ